MALNGSFSTPDIQFQCVMIVLGEGWDEGQFRKLALAPGPSSPPSLRAISALLFKNAGVEKEPFVVLLTLLF